MTVSLTRDAGIGIVTIDNPPVNAASHAVRAGLVAAIADAAADPSIDAIVIACAGRTFVAGADVKEFGQPPREPFLPDLVAKIENSEKPVVAAIHGTTLGGGFELALAAHGRVAAAGSQVGLPEVKLGIVPGAGGTQRLPRLAGMDLAIDMIGSGRRLDAEAAYAAGIVDRIAEGDLLESAKDLARSMVGKPPRRTGELPVPDFDVAAVEQRLARVETRARGEIAPVRAARLVRLAADTELQAGLAAERACFLELLGSPQSSALRYVFAAEREAGKIPDLASVEPRRIELIGIAGGGLMGSGIAAACLDAGLSVRIAERDEASANSARQRVEAIYARSVKSSRIDEKEAAARLDRLTCADSLAVLAECDLIVEAVFDDLDVKRDLLEKLSPVVRPDAIVATNTSYLDPDVLAASIDRPERFIGLHFFSPANVMRLVEVVRTASVSPEVLSSGLALTRRLGKLGIVSGVCEGFIGNRILTAYREECDFMLEEGALPHQIDEALEGFGFPMGPYAVSDMAGLEISWARRKRKAATRDPRDRYVVIADRLCEMGRFGQKAGKGYYRYEDGRRMVDPEVSSIVEQASRDAGIARREIDAEEILARVSGIMVAEGRAILEEGIALRASDIDLVLINGYGYPAWRGGPMYRAGIR